MLLNLLENNNAIRSNYFLFLSSSYYIQFEVYLQTLSETYLSFLVGRDLKNIKQRVSLIEESGMIIPSLGFTFLEGYRPCFTSLQPLINTKYRTHERTHDMMDNANHILLSWLFGFTPRFCILLLTRICPFFCSFIS